MPIRKLERRIALRNSVDNALYANIVCEDGHARTGT